MFHSIQPPSKRLMPLQTKPNEPVAFGISAQMARALTDPWRVRILAELSVRTLSPSRFIEKFGGDLTHISRCFRQLANWGYIEIVAVAPGRRQGAAIEHVYRGIQRAYFDTPSWEGVPRSERDAASRAAVNSYLARVQEAVQAGTFDGEVDRHLSWDGVALDERAWTQLGTRLDEVLAGLSDAEVEAVKRLKETEETPIPAVVGLSAFRSPQSPVVMLQASKAHCAPAVSAISDSFVIGPELAKALSNKWRCRIMMELTLRPLSPSQFVEKVGGSLSHISRCFRQLATWGFIEVLEERSGGRRGGVEKIYRNSQRPFFDTPAWRSLPRLVREEMSQSFLTSYFERITEAIEIGTFDADSDRHFSWKPLLLDRVGWEQIAACLDEVLAWLPDLEAESLARTSDCETLIPTIVGLASFRSPSRSDSPQRRG